jgi:hypothetical protein
MLPDGDKERKRMAGPHYVIRTNCVSQPYLYTGLGGRTPLLNIPAEQERQHGFRYKWQAILYRTNLRKKGYIAEAFNYCTGKKLP